MKILKWILAGYLLIMVNEFVSAQRSVSEGKSILIVVSSYGKDQGKIRPGFELDELSQAYLIFKEHGLTIDIASPRGSKANPDKYSDKKLYNKQFMSDQEAVNKMNNTLTTEQAYQKNKYDVLYVVGGKGAMFDLPYDAALQDLVLQMYKNNKIISSVCHGSAAFLHIKVDDSTYLVKDKMVTGLCNEEETKFSKKWIKEFPYLLETKLIERGAKYQREEIMLPFVVRDGLFISGQNPYSTTQLSESIIKALDIPLKTRTLYPDERSMNLVKRVTKGELNWAKTELKEKSSAYDVELIAAYAYYGLIYAEKNKDEIKQSLGLLDLVSPPFFNERMQLERAKGYLKLGDQEKGKKLLEELINKNLLVEDASKLMREADKMRIDG